MQHLYKAYRRIVVATGKRRRQFGEEEKEKLKTVKAIKAQKKCAKPSVKRMGAVDLISNIDGTLNIH